MFCSLRGLTALDPYANMKRVVITHPDVPHSLVMAPLDDSGYRLSGTAGLLKVGERSLVGSLKISGVLHAPAIGVEISAKVTQTQIDLFEWIKRAQDITKMLPTVQDYFNRVQSLPSISGTIGWLPNYPETSTLGVSSGFAAYFGFLSVDDAYKTPTASDWQLLQFRIEQKI